MSAARKPESLGLVLERLFLAPDTKYHGMYVRRQLRHGINKKIKALDLFQPTGASDQLHMSPSQAFLAPSLRDDGLKRSRSAPFGMMAGLDPMDSSTPSATALETAARRGLTSPSGARPKPLSFDVTVMPGVVLNMRNHRHPRQPCGKARIEQWTNMMGHDRARPGSLENGEQGK